MTDQSMSLQTFHNQLRLIADKERIPITGGFELTSRCNLNCTMCYVSKPVNDLDEQARELSAGYWIDLARQAAEMGTLSLLLTGGEAMLHPDFKEIYEAISKMGFRITLFSNGTLLTPELTAWLARIPPATLDITLYGASEETYGQVTGSRQAFSKAMRGIELAISQGINTRIKTTIIRKNLHDLEAIKKIAEDFGVEFSYSLLLHKAREGCNRCVEEERLSPAEIENLGTAQIPGGDLECSLPGIQELQDHFAAIKPLFCAAAKSAFWIEASGEMMPCPLVSRFTTQPIMAGFAKAWEELGNFITEVQAPSECLSCGHRPFCPVCPGRIFTETGSYIGHSDYVCDLAKVKEREFYSLLKRCGS